MTALFISLANVCFANLLSDHPGFTAYQAGAPKSITLKQNAPIWKKEHWQDGSSEWVSISACEGEH